MRLSRPFAKIMSRRESSQTLGGGCSSTVRALDCGSRGCGFETRHSPQTLQALFEIASGLEPMREPEVNYLVRVVVDVDRNPAEVVTAYRTSKIAKYWREEL